MILSEHDSLAVAVVEAIRSGDLAALQQLLADHSDLATARIAGEDANRERLLRTLLHVATDWPGHYPNGTAIVRLLLAKGAEVNARFDGPQSETPLHFAASSDDIEVLDVLLDAGADREAAGAVIAGGTALDDAVAFGQWRCARRLVERGAAFALWHAAALGRLADMEAHFAGKPLSRLYPWGSGSGVGPPPDEVTVAFWCACHGGQQQAAAYLLKRGAELNWISPWDGLTPLDAAERNGAHDVAEWLRSQGGKSAKEQLM